MAHRLVNTPVVDVWANAPLLPVTSLLLLSPLLPSEMMDGCVFLLFSDVHTWNITRQLVP